MSNRTARRGFTLVELLVVITIIGILMSLLLPAVQSSRESARSLQCSNNVKQLALGCRLHLAASGFYPSCGWGWNWAGDPDRGFGVKQPGGWLYSVLPFIDQKNMWSLGSGIHSDSQTAAKQAAMVQQLTTPLALFYCPSRRPVALYPSPYSAYNVSQQSNVSKTDYGINAGDTNTDQFFNGPTSLAQGDGWAECSANGWPCTTSLTGVSFQRSQISSGHFSTKGESNTYLCGDKYLNPDHYADGTEGADNEWATVGFDNDICRTADINLNPPDTPMQDTGGYDNDQTWGSAHLNGVRIAFCDGSVHIISYAIDPTTHGNLANRHSTAAIDPTKVQ